MLVIGVVIGLVIGLVMPRHPLPALVPVFGLYQNMRGFVFFVWAPLHPVTPTALASCLSPVSLEPSTQPWSTDVGTVVDT